MSRIPITQVPSLDAEVRVGTMPQNAIRIIGGGILGGLAGGLVMTFLYELPPIHALLFNPDLQSPLFLEAAPQRNMGASFAGLLVIGVVHAWLFSVVWESIPGSTWVKQGLFWGVAIWAVYWAFNEWFTFYAVLQQPLTLILLELPLLLLGACVEGLVIAFFILRLNLGLNLKEAVA